MGRARVRDVMTTDVVSVRETTPYRLVAAAMVEHHVSGVPVVDGQHRVVGVVSEADLLQSTPETVPDEAERALARRHVGPDGAGLPDEVLDGEVAAALMSSPPITCEAEEPVAAAGRRMAQHGVRRLPVVDATGRLVGVVSRRDLLRVHLRPDAALKAAVREQVLWEWLRVAPPDVAVEVHDGVVTLRGELPRRQAQLAVQLTRAVDGVVDVVDRLSYTTTDAPPGEDGWD